MDAEEFDALQDEANEQFIDAIAVDLERGLNRIANAINGNPPENEEEEDDPVEDEEEEGPVGRPVVDAPKEEPKDDEVDTILTVKGADMKGFSCTVCYEVYNTKKRLPKVFPCGHTFCITCVTNLFKSRPRSCVAAINCPTCRQNTRCTASTDPKKVSTNYSLLAMLEQRKEEQILEMADDADSSECFECYSVFPGAELTLCSCTVGKPVVANHEQKGFDNLRRPKHLLICESCIKKKHARHSYLPLERVVAKYEADRRVKEAEKTLYIGQKRAEDALLQLNHFRRELQNHRMRMSNALVNIREELHHPHIYEYLNRFSESVESSVEFFRFTVSNLKAMERTSQNRYYRSFGFDTLRPLGHVPSEQCSRAREVKSEWSTGRIRRVERARMPRDAEALLHLRRRHNFGPPGLVALPFIFAGDGDGPAPAVGDRLGGLAQFMRNAAVARPEQEPAGPAPAPAPVAALALPPIAEAPPPPPPPPLLGVNHHPLNFWAVQPGELNLANPAPRNRRADGRPDLRALAIELREAMAANPIMAEFPVIQNVINGLNEHQGPFDGLFAPPMPILPPPAPRRRGWRNDDVAAAPPAAPAAPPPFERDIENGLEELRVHMQRLEDILRIPAPLPPQPMLAPIPPRPDPERMPNVELIADVDRHDLMRVEIAALVPHLFAMVNAEDRAELGAELPMILERNAPGNPNLNELAPARVEQYLAELRDFEERLIAQARERGVEQQEEGPVQEEALVQEDAPEEQNQDNDNANTERRREGGPLQDEPAAKRRP